MGGSFAHVFVKRSIARRLLWLFKSARADKIRGIDAKLRYKRSAHRQYTSESGDPCPGWNQGPSRPSALRPLTVPTSKCPPPTKPRSLSTSHTQVPYRADPEVAQTVPEEGPEALWVERTRRRPTNCRCYTSRHGSSTLGISVYRSFLKDDVENVRIGSEHGRWISEGLTHQSKSASSLGGARRCCSGGIALQRHLPRSRRGRSNLFQRVGMHTIRIRQA